LGALRDTQNYVRSIERGLTIFDLAPSVSAIDRTQWEPLLAWLRPILQPAVAANDTSHAPGNMLAQRNGAGQLATPQSGSVLDGARALGPIGASRPNALMPQQESLVHGGRLAASSARTAEVARAVGVPKPSVLNQPDAGQRLPNLIGGLPIPQFLKRAG
jgi:chromosome partitioning protein